MRTMALVAVGAVAVWLVLVFGSALARSDAVEREAAQARAELAALEQRLEAGRAEIELMQTDHFLSMQARAYGRGRTGERPFALEAGAPSAVPIVPLGARPEVVESPTPLEEWLELLFG
jgi:cell division protein FtsB